MCAVQVDPLAKFALFQDLAHTLGSDAQTRAALVANFIRVATKSGSMVRVCCFPRATVSILNGRRAKSSLECMHGVGSDRESSQREMQYCMTVQSTT